MEKEKEKEYNIKMMVINTRVIGRIIEEMEKEYFMKRMVIYMKVTG